MCSNLSKHQGVLDFCLFKCNYHPLERLCFIPWAAKFLKSGRKSGLLILPENKSMLYFPEHSEVEGTHNEFKSPVNGPVGIKAVPWVPPAPLSDQLSQSQARSWALSHVCSYSPPTSTNKPKAALEAQELGAAIPHCGSGSWRHF